MNAPAINDMTLDELRPLVARALTQDAAFDGWSPRALEAVSERLGLNPDIAGLLFPGGAVDMIDTWFETVDADMLNRVPPDALAPMKIRGRITALIEARLAILAPNRESLRRAQAILASPRHAARALRLGWRAADVMWRAAGDTATDYNHYSKRAILGGIYAATALVFVNDESDGQAETRAFLARRIEGIMRFEKTKARFSSGSARSFSLARFAGRLRYPT